VHLSRRGTLDEIFVRRSSPGLRTLVIVGPQQQCLILTRLDGPRQPDGWNA
jgi:hypothetical protein